MEKTMRELVNYFVSCVDGKERKAVLKFSVRTNHPTKAHDLVENYIRDYKLRDLKKPYGLKVRRMRNTDEIDYEVPVEQTA